jgi:hypothetical protein
LPTKLTASFFSLALIAAVAARQFDARQAGEVELNNGFKRLGGGTGLQAVGKSRQPIGIGGL